MHPGYFPVLLWSLVILASFWGYGEALRRWLNRKEFSDLGWGLTMAWGMGVVLGVVGILMAFQAATAPFLTAIVLLGASFAAVFASKDFTEKKPPASKNQENKSKKIWQCCDQAPIETLGLLIIWILAILAFASSIAWPHHIDPNDDLICYLMLPIKLLATGTIIEPFSFQRAGTFGGQAILQALVMIVGAERNGHVPDRGIAMLIIFGILLHATKGLKGKYAIPRLLILFTFWFVPVPRISTNGAMTGGALLLASIMTFQLFKTAKVWDWRLLLPSGMLLAGTCSIRPTFAVAAGLIYALLAIWDAIDVVRARSKLRELFLSYITVGVIAILLIIPFMYVLYQSNGTPMVPPVSGFVSKAYQTYAFNEASKDWGAILSFFSVPQASGMLGVVLLALFVRPRSLSIPVVLGILLAGVIILHRFSALAFLDQYRYLYPIFIPLGLWLIALGLHSSATNSLQISSKYSRFLPIIAASAICLFLIGSNVQQGSIELREQIVNLPKQIRNVEPFFDPRLRRAYGHLQSLVPPGEKILTMVDASYWFDFRRNPIFSINAVGGSAPPPGIPFGKGPEALATYLRSLGFRYVIAVDFNNAVLLYTRRLWNEATRPEWFYSAIWKPRFNDFMDNIDSLASHPGALLSTAGNSRLIDLGQ